MGKVAFSPEAFVARDKLGQLLGARFVSLSAGVCVYHYEVREEHFNPGGILHGGALFSVMDSSQGMLVFAELESPFVAAATGTATVKYLAPVTRGLITIETRLEKRERRKLFVHSDALNAQGSKVAVLDEIWIAFEPS